MPEENENAKYASIITNTNVEPRVEIEIVIFVLRISNHSTGQKEYWHELMKGKTWHTHSKLEKNMRRNFYELVDENPNEKYRMVIQKIDEEIWES